MSDKNHDGQLGAVYDATTVEEVAALYDNWASTYDAEMSVAGYRHPTICLALLARHLPRGTTPLLDAGVGTGLIGEWLAIMGFSEVDGLDISAGMLAVARRKNIYRQLHQLALGSELPFADDHYAGIVSTGVFTTGHVGPEGLDELVRVCRTGGVIVATVKDSLWQESFKARVDELDEAKRATLVEDTGAYVSMPGEAGTKPSRGIVLKVL